MQLLFLVQRDVQAQLAVLSDRLYKTIRAEQVMPGESPAKRPDLAHWRTVLVRCSPNMPMLHCLLQLAFMVILLLILSALHLTLQRIAGPQLMQ